MQLSSQPSVKLIHRKLSLTPFDPDREYKHKIKLFFKIDKTFNKYVFIIYLIYDFTLNISF